MARARVFFPRGVAVLGVTIALLMAGLTAQSKPNRRPGETFYYFVFSNPVAGQEVKFNEWYSQQHQLDVVSIPGFVSTQRFQFNDVPLYRDADVKLPKYLVVYQIVTDDLDAVFGEVSRRLRTKETVIDPSFDGSTSVSYVYRALGPWIKGVGGEGVGAKPGPKTLYYHLVFTPFVERKEEEFNRIYTEHHAPELAAIPGFTGAQRLVMARPDTARLKGTKYAALFTVETSDFAATKRGTAVRGTANPGQDFANTRGYTYRAITPEVSGDAVRASRATKK
jgi:hypothetical protein